MNRTALRTLAAVAGLVACDLPAAAQARLCGDRETLQECQQRLFEEADAGAAAAQNAAGRAVGTERAELQKEAAGPNLAELAQSAIRDFLPRFAGELLTTNATEDLPAVNLRFNAPIRWGSRDSARVTVQGGVTLHQAEVFGPLLDSIPAGMRAASRERLEGELEDGDDATLSAAVNVESRRLGRAFAPHRPLADALVRELRAAVDAEGPFRPQAEAAIEAFFNRLSADRGTLRRPEAECAFRQARTYPVECLSVAGRQEYESFLAPFVQFERRRQTRLTAGLEGAGFDRISDLVNNQPQVNFTVEYRSRLGVVGPNEWTGRARWEVGGSNMNRLRRFCAQSGVTGVPVECLRAYTGNAKVKRSLARGERAWVEAVARYRPEYRVALPDDSAAFAAGSATGFGVRGGYGSYLGGGAVGEERDRLDLHLSYDFARDDELRQDRWLAGLFYTLRLSGSASGVVGVAWANRPEFLDGTDRRLHANLGLTYKVNRGNPDPAEAEGGGR